jgi:hypothetical protein
VASLDHSRTGHPRGDLAAAREQIRQLESALESRILIEQAKGVLRERFGWSAQDAFEILRYAARSTRIKIHALAADVVASGETPAAVTVALARGARWRAAHHREYAEAQRARAAQLMAQVRAQQERLARDEDEATDRRGARSGIDL